MEEEKKIYIGNLDYSVAEEDLKKILQDKGLAPTDVKIIKDKLSGRSKGFGFAEFEKNEEVKTAIESLDGQELKGRKLRVNQARKPEPKSPRRDSSNFRRQEF